MPLQLPANKLLPYCSAPLNDFGSESKNGLFRYADGTVKALLKEEAAAYDKLKLSVYDGILSGRHSVSELTRKKHPHAAEQLCAKLMPCLFLSLLTKGKPLFIYRITDKGLTPPQQITVELSGSAEGCEGFALALQKSSARRSPFPLGLKRRTEELSLRISVSLMRSAADDLRFISRYNEETFFRGLSERSFVSPLIDLSDKSVRIGFTVLYAMTFHGLTERDVFTVDGVFGFTDMGVRSKDDIRRKAAAELSSCIMEGSAKELAEIAEKMAARLRELPLPAVDVNDPALLARNLTLYAGLAQVGKAYLAVLPILDAALVPDPLPDACQAAKPRAELMSGCVHALQLCQGILTLLTAKKPQLSSLNGYKQTQLLQHRLERETAK